MQCLTTYRLKTGEDVPCGRCPACLKRRVSGWSFRLMEENKWARSAHFVTLTYDTSVVPISPNGRMTLKKRDFQLFMKRLRFLSKKEGNDKKLLYYACGEYGSKTWRPHYHAIIFNANMDTIQEAWKLNDSLLGHVHIDEVNGATINYTLKYMSKSSRVPLYRGDDRLPEFSLMSKGLGISYVNDAARSYHEVIKYVDGKLDLSHSRMFLVMPGGYKVAMPRYYKQKLFTDEFNRSVIAWISGKKAREKFQEKVGNAAYFRDLEQSIQAALRSFKKDETGRSQI